jgi:hypothetical protein
MALDTGARRQRFLIAFLLIAMGLFTIALVALYPEKLRVPAWVAYAPLATFPLAGTVILLQSCGARRIAGWLGLFLVIGLLVPGFWIAFGPGPMTCTVSLLGVSGAGSDWMCRIGFGIASLIGALVLAVVVARFLRARKT